MKMESIIVSKIVVMENLETSILKIANYVNPLVSLAFKTLQLVKVVIQILNLNFIILTKPV